MPLVLRTAHQHYAITTVRRAVYTVAVSVRRLYRRAARRTPIPCLPILLFPAILLLLFFRFPCFARPLLVPVVHAFLLPFLPSVSRSLLLVSLLALLFWDG